MTRKNQITEESAFPPKILFITHTVYRSGAPISLLHLLRWLKQKTDIQFGVLVTSYYETEHDLIEDFRALATVYIFSNKHKPQNKLIEYLYRTHRLRRVIVSLKHKFLKRQIRQDNYSLIYSNTAANWAVLEFLTFLQVPVISHIRELDVVLSHFGQDNVDTMKKRSTHFIAVSQAVQQNLVCRHAIEEHKISLVRDFIGIPTLEDKALKALNKSTRMMLDIPEDAFVVGGSGNTIWTKGPDLFIQLAGIVNRMSKDGSVFFVWVGGVHDDKTYRQLMHDIKYLDLDGFVKFLGHKSNPLNYFAAFDVFAMVSRQEALGMVNLEAASLGKPIICFDGAGGPQEFVEGDCGFVVPYLDLRAMAEKIVELRKYEVLRLQLGANARKKVIEEYNIDSASERILEIIESQLNQRVVRLT